MNILIWAVHLLIIYFIARLIIGRVTDQRLRINGWVSLGLKLIAGVLLGWIYLSYYDGGDTFAFDSYARPFVLLAKSDFISYFRWLAGIEETTNEALRRAPRLLFMVKIVSFVHLITGSSYWLSALYFTLFSWMGLYRLAVTASNNFPAHRIVILFALLYLPSVVFWSSGLTKESIAMGAFGLLMVNVLPGGTIRPWRVIITLLMIFILWMIKYYYVIPVFASVFLYYLLVYLKDHKISIALSLISSLVLLALIVAAAGFFNQNLSVVHLPEVIYQNYSVFQEKSEAGDAMVLSGMCDEWHCLLKSAAPAAWNTLFRKYVWETTSLFSLLAAVENLLFLLFFVAFIYSFRNAGRWTFRHILFLICAFIFVGSLAGFLGMSAPNFGTLARYRVILLPVMILLFCHEPDVLRKLKSRFRQFVTPS